MSTTPPSDPDSAVAAAVAALAEIDHTRLPLFLVARIAVDSARSALTAEHEDSIRKLQEEIALLRREQAPSAA